jgi:hypothetical protein
MGDAAKVVRKVGVYNVRMAAIKRLFHIEHRLLGIAARAIRVFTPSSCSTNRV